MLSTTLSKFGFKNTSTSKSCFSTFLCFQEFYQRSTISAPEHFIRRENIFVRPNDVIFLTRESPTFTALGALNQNVFGFNSEIPFDVESLSLAQAMGKAGGLNDNQSDPSELYVYRYEQRHYLEKLGVDTTRFASEMIPTIYHLNLRDPAGMLLASAFQMKIKDVMYVANAKVVDYYKLLLLINNTATAVSSTANAVTNVNTAVKTKW